MPCIVAIKRAANGRCTRSADFMLQVLFHSERQASVRSGKGAVRLQSTHVSCVPLHDHNEGLQHTSPATLGRFLMLAIMRYSSGLFFFLPRHACGCQRVFYTVACLPKALCSSQNNRGLETPDASCWRPLSPSGDEVVHGHHAADEIVLVVLDDGANDCGS